MNNEPSAPSTPVVRPGRVRATALNTAIPIALAVGAVFAAPIAAAIPHITLDRSAGANLSGDCHARTAQATLASAVGFGAAGAAKWPDCAGE
jgi:hypothetical protein